ncbi:MAG: FecR domain-containing protein [Planctomycetota bacterium]
MKHLEDETSAELHELISGLLDDEVTAAQMDALSQLTEKNESAAQLAADLISQHRLLGVLHQLFDESALCDSVMQKIDSAESQVTDQIVATLPATPPSSFGAICNYVVAAMLLVMVAWWFSQSRSDSSIPRQPAAIATLILDVACVWQQDASFREGQRLSPQNLNLRSGTAVLRFDGGAELVMTGKSSLELVSGGRASLNYGNIVVRADVGPDGFALDTPASPLVDLGTEFAVKVEQTGATELHVLDGEVEYRDGSSANVLGAGAAIRFAGAKADAEPIELNAERYTEVIRRLNPQPQRDRMTLYEGFNYDLEGTLPLPMARRGIGWSGPWRLRTSSEMRISRPDFSPDQLHIVQGEINVAWPVPEGRGGMLKMPAGGAIYVRPMKRPIALDQAGVTYLSMMVRETERPQKRRNPPERIRVTFRSSEDFLGESICFGYGHQFRPHIRIGNGQIFASPVVAPAEQTTLWICKIVTREVGEDELFFRVYGEDDELGYAEPATWHAVSRDVELSAKLDRVLLSSTGDIDRIVDELRVGPTWRSVAPMSEKK